MNYKILTLSLFSLQLSLVACSKTDAPPSTPAPTEKTTAANLDQIKPKTKDKIIPAVWSKSYRMPLTNNEVCHTESEDEAAACTIYDLQSVKTNIEWINQYYDKDIRKNFDAAFGAKSTVKLEGEDADRKYYEGSIVSFVSQRYNLVTFSQFNNSYSGGAHNVYYNQYDVFDLATEKKISLNDILKPNAKAKVLALLKQQNESDLQEYGTDLSQMKLSENFYFGENGLVFVYSLYEIAPFVMGMPELSIDYESLKDLLKSQYLPSEPDRSLSQNYS